MKQSVYFDNFADAFKDIRPNNFSWEGLRLLWDYLEQLEDDLGEELELDVIAFCCDYYEADAQELANDLDMDEDEMAEECEGMDEEEVAQYVAEKLADLTTVLGVTSDNSIVYQAY